MHALHATRLTLRPRSRCAPPCGAGTGLRNVRGLLRRPQATALVQKMQNGELRPGEVQSLLEDATTQMKAAEAAGGMQT
jgi:hypothetical protein